MSAKDEPSRAAIHLLRRMARGHARLVPLDGGDYALKMQSKPIATRVDAVVVEEFRKRGWLAPRPPDALVLSEAGEGVFLRAQASEDPFAAQHQLRRISRIQTAEGERDVMRNDGESPLGWMARRNIVDAMQFAAGERLRRDFTLAQLAPRLGVDLSAPVVLGSRGANAGANVSDTAIDARRRFSAAMKGVGPGLSDLLFDVCCHLLGLEEAERAKGWPQRSAKVVLRIALDRLAAHYGMHAPTHARVRSWREE